MGIIILCFILVLTGCDSGKRELYSEDEVIPGVEILGENLLDLRKIYVIRPAIILRPGTDFLPRTYNMEKDIIDEVNTILEDKINTLIDIEYVPYEKQSHEILKKLYAYDNVDIIDYALSDPEQHINNLNIADLTDILPVYYPELYEPGNDFNDIYTDGRIYVMPRVIAESYQDRLCIIIDREFYESAGRLPIKTTNDIFELYEFGVNNKNKQGTIFLDRNADRYFMCPFYQLLMLYCQENGCVFLNTNLYAFNNGEILDLVETDIIKDCYTSIEKMYSKNALYHLPFDSSNWLPDHSPIPGLGMALATFSEIFNANIKNPLDFYNKYEIMFITDCEPYSQKKLFPMMLICHNENIERAVIALRLLYQDKELNQLLTYGVKDKHYRINSNRMEMLWEPFSVFKWWPSIVNPKYNKPMMYSPEGTENYIQYLYEYPKQIITGIDNNKIRYNSEMIGMLKTVKETSEALEQRLRIVGSLSNYIQTISKGILYDDLISEMEKEKQEALLENMKLYINSLK